VADDLQSLHVVAVQGHVDVLEEEVAALHPLEANCPVGISAQTPGPYQSIKAAQVGVRPHRSRVEVIVNAHGVPSVLISTVAALFGLTTSALSTHRLIKRISGAQHTDRQPEFRTAWYINRITFRLVRKGATNG